MSERLIALADAADASECGPCCYGNAPNYQHAEAYEAPDGRGFEWPRWYHSVEGGQDTKCLAAFIRSIVECEHPGLGSRPTSEWRRKETRDGKP